MRTFSIENFGPIDGWFEMDLDKKLTILIGEQATGKSTIARKVAEENYESIYIPAGRSMFPLIFSSYNAASRLKIDPLTDKYLLFLDNLRSVFNVSLYENAASIVADSSKIDKSVMKENVEEALSLVGKIMKGKYVYAPSDERIYVGDDLSVPITSASSGQQEILFILLTLLFILITGAPEILLIIEEPEAHIFPAAQKLVMELIARVINATGSRVIITTHSPYILTSTNLLIHSAMVENKINDDKTVIDKMARLNPDDVSAFLLSRNGKFSYKSIIDTETGLIDAEEIDTVSQIIDKGMADLVDLEVKHGL